MCDEIDSRGLEVFLAMLLLIGEANIAAVSLNKQQGFFTMNVASRLFDWRTPLVSTTATTKTPSSPTTPVSTKPAVTPTAVTPIEANSTLYNRLPTDAGETDPTDSANVILFGILLIAVFLLEDPFNT